MQDRDDVTEWLLRALDLAEITGIWLYGSYFRGVPDACDVDLIARFKDGHADNAAKLRRNIEADFGFAFVRPLHAIFLSEREFREEAGHLSNILKNACRVK